MTEPRDVGCPECDWTGEVEEGCCCYQCEYDDSAHRRVIPCPNCADEPLDAGGLGDGSTPAWKDWGDD